MSTSARTILTAAAKAIGAIGIGDTLSADNAAEGLQALNWMLDQLGLQPSTMPVRTREVFDMTADKGGPSNPYTIGSGGNFNTSRPARLEGASLLLTASSPDVEVPLTLFTDDGYDAVQVKDLSNSQPTGVYYQPASPLGKIYLWPVPDTATNDLVLYWNEPWSTFTTLNTARDLPTGAEEMLVYNVACRLATAWGRELPLNVLRLATASLTTYKRMQIRLSDVPQDIFTGNRRYGYNINTGTGGGAS